MTEPISYLPTEPLSPEAQAAHDRIMREYVGGLPEASGTFTGTFGPDVDVEALFGPALDLLPIEIDTGDQPNPAVGIATTLTITFGDEEYELPIHHTERLEGNRVTVWVRAREIVKR